MVTAEEKTESEDCGGGGAEDCLGSAEVRKELESVCRRDAAVCRSSAFPQCNRHVEGKKMMSNNQAQRLI